MTVRANEPPAVDVRQLARLQLDNGGGVESIVIGGANPAREHIESEAERVERTAREAAQRAREAAQRARELRVDWTSRRDIRRTPSLLMPMPTAVGGSLSSGGRKTAQRRSASMRIKSCSG